jgi:hypothetical protein
MLIFFALSPLFLSIVAVAVNLFLLVLKYFFGEGHGGHGALAGDGYGGGLAGEAQGFCYIAAALSGSKEKA